MLLTSLANWAEAEFVGRFFAGAVCCWGLSLVEAAGDSAVEEEGASLPQATSKMATKSINKVLGGILSRILERVMVT